MTDNLTSEVGHHYRFDAPRRIVVITWPAIVPDMQTVRSTVDALLADRAMKSGYPYLSDWRLAPAAPAANYVHSFITFLERIDKRGVRRWATVVKADSDASFEVGRTIETHAELAGLQYRVFRDYEAALMWLDSPGRP